MWLNKTLDLSFGISSVQLFSHVQLFVIPWTAAFQASLSITHSQSLLKTHVQWVDDSIQPSLPLSSPSPPPSIFPRIRVFFSESVLCIMWPKYWSFSFSFSISPSVRGVCNFLSSISSQQKSEAMAVKTLGVSQLESQLLDRLVLQLSDRSVLQLHVTAQFYLENKGKYILKAWGHADPKDSKIRESPGPFAPLFICFFPSPLSLPLCKVG